MNLTLREQTLTTVRIMKRFYVAIPSESGAVELHPMKEWLRQHPVEVPSGLDATTSTSHQLRDGLRRTGWTAQETDHDVRLIRPADQDRVAQVTQVLGEDDDLPSQPDQAFALEHHLRDFLAENLHTIRVNGRRVRLFVDATGRDGVEYPTDIGVIDLLALDEDDGFVVFELKRASVADRAVGQLARYMGWVKHTIGRDKAVRGVVVARSIDNRLRFAASVIPEIHLFEYTVEFLLHEAHDLPM